MKKIVLLFIIVAIAIIGNSQNKSTIHFDSNKYDLKNEYKQTLDSIADILKSANTYHVSINAYCDNTGADNANELLAEKRADAVYDYLKIKNISSQYINKKSFGEQFPIADNGNEEGKAKNRRVEIIVNVTFPTTELVKETVVEPLPVQKSELFTPSISIDDLKVGETIILQNLNFKGGEAVLLPEGEPVLKALLKIMLENPSLEIEIGGHVCCASDMHLSVLRALYVYDYLIQNGVKKKRMTYKGYNRSKPIYKDDNGDEEKARANRRVEITILKK